MATEFWNCRMFCIITGASKGLGRSIAVNFCEKAKRDSTFLLLARNLEGLKETELEMMERNNSIRVVIKSVDLKEPDSEEFQQMIRGCLQQFNDKACNFDRSFLVHNAGSLGDLSKDSHMFTDLNELKSYFDLNLNSVIILTSIYLQIFEKSRFIVNVSSLAALKPFKGWHLYCTGKAARDAYFRVIAEDESISTLSYSPGPLDTDMVKEIISTAADEHREWFRNAKSEGTLIACDETVAKLMSIIKSEEFKSGSHVDFYDVN